MNYILSKLQYYILFPLRRKVVFFSFMYLLGVVCIISDPAVNKTITFFELFLDIYIVCMILSLIPDRISKVLEFLLCVLLYIIAIVDIFLIVRLGAPITPTFMQMVLETDYSEATEALSSYISINSFFSPILLVLGIIVLHFICWLSYRKRQTSTLSNSRKSHILFIIICTLLVNSTILSLYPKKFLTMMVLGNHATNLNMQGWGFYKPDRIYYIPIYKFIYSIKQNTFGKEEIKELKEGIEKTRVDSCSFYSPNIIVIIGESHNKHHSQLYGYNKETTPFQLKEAQDGRLVVYSDVITSYNVTTDCFKNMFSLFCYGMKGRWSNYPLFPVVFKRAGYHTSFITNQFALDMNGSFYDFDAGMFFNNRDISMAQFDVRNQNRHEYDEDLLNDYDSLKQYNQRYNLHIFHLRGLHMKYLERYPKKWNKFKPSDYHRPDLSISDREVLATYDNATLYNDYVLNELIKQFEKDDAVVIYVPDHGETVFDGCQSFGRPMIFDANNLFQQFQIPFWIYMSDKYQINHPEMAKRIINAKDKPFMTDNISQLLLGLAGIQTVYYKAYDNPLENSYNANRKRLIRGQYNYDDIMDKYDIEVSN